MPEEGGVTGVGVASVSQAVPVNPVLHWHVPEEEQVPFPLQSGDPGQSGVLKKNKCQFSETFTLNID